MIHDEHLALPRKKHSNERYAAPSSAAQHRQFLPLALEALETPPSPLGRSVLWILVTLFLLAILWACLGRVDIVVSANGRVIPTGHAKVLQAPETASVDQIHVRDGDRVATGDVLITFDSTVADADSTSTTQEIAYYRAQAHWRSAVEDWLSGDSKVGGQLPRPAHVSNQYFDRADVTYARFIEETSSEIESIDREIGAAEAALASQALEERRAKSSLSLLDQRVAAYKSIVERQYGAKLQYLELLQHQSELRASIPIIRARQTQLSESIAANRAQRRQTLAQTRRENLMALADLDVKLTALEQEARKSSRRREIHRLIAPVDGTIQEIAVHTLGAIVTPAQSLLKIVPSNGTIEVEALLPNRDVGFVTEGQRAEVKVDAFNFTRYGLLKAKVLDISDDAIQDEKIGWAYKVRLELEDQEFLVENKTVSVMAGMAVTAEIRTGRRRLIEFLLSPLLRHRQESFRSR